MLLVLVLFLLLCLLAEGNKPFGDFQFRMGGNPSIDDDYYRFLGLAKDADNNTIKKAKLITKDTMPYRRKRFSLA